MGTISESDGSVPSGPLQITSLVAYSKGFACACGPGTVWLYEKTDDKDFFKKTREIKVNTILKYHSYFTCFRCDFSDA